MKLADLKVDDEFKNLIQPLTADELEQLEKNILEDGEVREPLVAWNGTLIDGHNRYSILKKHPEIPYKINEVVFFSRNEALVWIINNQLGRRNLNKADAIDLADKKAEVTAQMAKDKQREYHGNQYDKRTFDQMDESPKTEPINTRAEIAKTAGVSEGTVARYHEVKKKKPELVDKIRKGEMTIGGAYKEVKREERAADKIEESEKIIEAAINHELPAVEETQKPTYTVDNLIEEVNAGADNYVRFLKQTLVNRSTTYADPENRKRVYDAISNLISKIEDIQKILK